MTNMLILNIKSKFDVIGTYTDEKGDPKMKRSCSINECI